MSSPAGSPSKAKVIDRLYGAAMEKNKQKEEKRQQALKAEETKLLTIGVDKDSTGKILPKKLTKESMEKMVDSVYKAPMEKAKKNEEKRQRERLEQQKASTKPMSSAECQEMVQKMYYMETDKRKTKAGLLEKKYQPPPVSVKLDSDKTKEVNARLYEATKGKKEAKVAELYQKYNGSDLPKSRKLGKGEQEAMAARLAAKA